MDKVGQMAVSWNFDALKEPRGFIKLIEFIIAIFAFATTTSSHTSSSFTTTCKGPTTTTPVNTYQYYYGYPFKLDSGEYTYKTACNETTSTDTFQLYGDFSAPSQFYVFVGVMAFLYSIAAVILYVCFDDKYRKHDQIPIADFIITAVFALLWLISAAAWADGVSKVKFYSDPTELFMERVKGCDSVFECTVSKQGNFASLNVSIIFGFLCMAVWGGNLWFLFKETKWHKVQTEHPQMSPSETPQKV